MENENNGTNDVQKKSKQKIIIVCIILGLIFITLVLLGTCRGSDKESSDQPVNVEFTENEYETLIPIYIGGIEFNCIIDEDFGSFIISSDFLYFKIICISYILFILGKSPLDGPKINVSINFLFLK